MAGFNELLKRIWKKVDENGDNAAFCGTVPVRFVYIGHCANLSVAEAQAHPVVGLRTEF